MFQTPLLTLPASFISFLASCPFISASMVVCIFQCSSPPLPLIPIPSPAVSPRHSVSSITFIVCLYPRPTHPFLPYPHTVQPYPALPCPVLPRPTHFLSLPYPTLPCLALPSPHTLLCPTMTCPSTPHMLPCTFLLHIASGTGCKSMVGKM